MEKNLSKFEFIPLMALMTSIVALAIDGVLPAFSLIEADFQVTTPSKLILIIASLFFGFGLGQLCFGQLSDIFGRKRPVYWGLSIFMLGSLLSFFSQSYDLFILGRFLQGFGGASTRIISLALIRDEYSGNSMAHITSLVMSVFIIVPALAPLIGQGVMTLSHWRYFFILLFTVGALIWIWFGTRQRETLPSEQRLKMTWPSLKFGIKETFSNSITVSCMLISGALFGAFLGYLGSVEQIFSQIFNAGDNFPLYFALLASSIGVASFSNSRLVMKLGMYRLIIYAFVYMLILSGSFLFYLNYIHIGEPSLMVFMFYMVLLFLSVGFLFGNLNAMAMEPLGHIAGIGSALLSFVQSTLSVFIGLTIGPYFYQSVIPLVLTFTVMSFLCLLILFFQRQFFSQIELTS